ncbi:MAG: DUF1887 family protein [Bacteroidales bacterium]|nr:DUF1887 family protein [Bacteroidales bacterium]
METKTLLISLVSDQTRPNVQLAKELKITDYLFISTEAMERKGCRKWIENALNISDNNLLKVDENSFEDIKNKLDSFDYTQYDEIIVNLTGGTKVMTLVVSEYFKNTNGNVRMFYITNKNELLQSYPDIQSIQWDPEYTLSEYMKSYGFDCSDMNKLSCCRLEQATKIYEAFSNNNNIYEEYNEAIKFIQSKRGRNISTNDYNKVKSYLEYISFTPKTANQLSKEETKYLSGDWFEEYVGLKLKQELQLTDDNIWIGTKISKELAQTNKNDKKILVGEDAPIEDEKLDNEMDIMFMYKGKFYTIECKTSILTIIDNKPKNILGNTIYKADSLQKKFGLYADTTIITLTNFNSFCKDSKNKYINNKISSIGNCINRANLSNIRIIDGAMMKKSKTIYSLLGIKL